MNTVEKFYTGAFALIALFLVASNAGSFNTILNGLASFNTSTFRTLQGR